MSPATTIVFFALAVCSASHAADRRVLAGIREAEGVKDPAVRGPAGELGFYRITPAAWRQHTTAPFERAATDAAFEERIAIRHLDWIERELVRAGFTPTPFRLALAWNAGLEGSTHGRAPAAARSYAHRVANLVGVAP